MMRNNQSHRFPSVPAHFAYGVGPTTPLTHTSAATRRDRDEDLSNPMIAVMQQIAFLRSQSLHPPTPFVTSACA